MAVLHSSSVDLVVFSGAFTGGFLSWLWRHLSNFLTNRSTGTLSWPEKLTGGLCRVAFGTICDLGSFGIRGVDREGIGCGGELFGLSGKRSFMIVCI